LRVATGASSRKAGSRGAKEPGVQGCEELAEGTVGLRDVEELRGLRG